MAGSRGGFVQDTLSPTEVPNTVAAPIDTYQAVTKSQSPGAQFLEGLGKLAKPATDAMVNFDQAAGDKAEADANLKALTATPDELRAEISSGNFYGLAHRRAQSALRVMDASNRVFDAASQLDGMNQRGELQGPDAQAKLALIVGQHADAVAGDPLAEKQFTAGMMPVMRKYTTDILRNNVQNDETNKAAKLYSYMVGLHDQVDRDALDNPTDPDTLSTRHKQALFRTADYAKNELLMSPKAIQDVVGKVAQHYADTGNTAALNAIGKYDRNGSPLSDQYGPQWDAWKKKAETVSDAAKKKAANSDADGLAALVYKGGLTQEDFNKQVDAASVKDPENFGAARAEQLKAQYQNARNVEAKQAVAALSSQQEKQYQRDYVEKGAHALLSGTGYMVPEQGRFTAADGVERTYTRKDLQPAMLERAEGLISAQANNEGWSPEDTLRAKVRLFGVNGLVNPTFKNSFTDLYNGSKAGIPANPESLPQRLGQLEFLRTNDPNQFANMGRDDKQQATWLAAYRVAREYGSEPERAYSIANSRVFKPENNERLTGTALDAKVDDVLKKWTSGGGLFSSSLGVLPGQIARGKAADAVNLAVAAGTAEKDIVDKATEALTRDHLIVKGIPLHNNIPGVGDPAVASEYLKDGADYYKKSQPGLRNQPFDIAFADDPRKPGNYMPVRTDTMEPILRPGAGGSSISGETLRDYVMQHRERDRVEKKANADVLERTKNLPPEPLPEPTDAELREVGKQRRKAVGDVVRKIVGTPKPNEPPTVKDLRGD